METDKEYVKGFVLDRELVARVAGIENANDQKVDLLIHNTIKGLNRDAYEFIGAVYQPTLPGQDDDENLAVAIVLAIGDDEEELRVLELGPIDETILAARLMLIGPGVWELWG
jgi:hypothetical protein